jgi:hypothetical protein
MLLSNPLNTELALMIFPTHMGTEDQALPSRPLSSWFFSLIKSRAGQHTVIDLKGPLLHIYSVVSKKIPRTNNFSYDEEVQITRLISKMSYDLAAKNETRSFLGEELLQLRGS